MSGDLEASMAINYMRGRSTVSNIVARVCKAIWKGLQPIVMPQPSETIWKNIAAGYMDKWQMPNCCGAVDGKHCVVTCPPNSGTLDYNYKGAVLLLELYLLFYYYTISVYIFLEIINY